MMNDESMTVAGEAITSYVAPITCDAKTPGIASLGCGINAATGTYLFGYLEQVVDLDALIKVVQLTPLNSMASTSVVGETTNSYLTTQTATVGISGGYAGFSGSLNTSFGMSESETGTNSLATATSITQLYQLTIPASERANILTADFKDALYHMEPQKFYSQYGAYFTSEIVVGGSFSSSIQTTTTADISTTSLSIDAKASLAEGVGHGAIGASYDYTSKTNKTTYTCSTGIVIIGGDLNPAKLDSGAIDVDSWQKTIPTSPAVVKWSELRPMWELISDKSENSQRISDLKGALDAYFNQPNAYTTPSLTLKCFTASSESVTGPEPIVVTVPPGYKVLCGGASLQQDKNNNQFLTASNVINSTEPNQWTASAKSVDHATAAVLTAYAIAVYDPNNLLDIKVFETTSSSAKYPEADVTVDPSYVMTGGGTLTTPSNVDGLMLTESYPSNNTTWHGKAKEHIYSCPGTVTVRAIGIKWANPNGKPALHMEIVSNPSPRASAPTQTVSASTDFTLVGGGAKDDYGSGSGNMLQDSYPTTDSNKAKVWSAQGHDCTASNDAILTAYAIGLQVQWQSKDGTVVKVPFGPGCLTSP